MPKSVLYKRLQAQFNIERLQRANSRGQAKMKRNRDIEEDEKKKQEETDCSDNKKFKSKQSKVTTTILSSNIQPMMNTIDPIMLAPIGKKHFDHNRPNGTICRFNVETLVDYLLVSGDFLDPETRIPFSNSDLMAIDVRTNELGLKKPSVLEAKLDLKRFEDAKFRRDAMQGLERCAGEVVAEILEIVEECDREEGEIRLAMSEFPAFADYYRQMREADEAYAKNCLNHWKLFLSGPPNRPTSDEVGLLTVVLNFLNDCDRLTIQALHEMYT